MPADLRENLPINAVVLAIISRLTGAIVQLDGVTPMEVFDHIPRDHVTWDFISVDEITVTPHASGNPKMHEVEVELLIYSGYSGYKELASELDQVVQYLASTLTFSDSRFVDTSIGGKTTQVGAGKRETDDAKIIRQGTIRRSWLITDVS